MSVPPHTYTHTYTHTHTHTHTLHPVQLWESYKAAMRAAAAAGSDPGAAAEQLLVPEVGARLSGQLYRLLFKKGVPPEQVAAAGGGGGGAGR